MASTSKSITLQLHGGGVANSGDYPAIYANFDITFTRTEGSSTVNWSVSNNHWGDSTHSGNGHYAYHFYAFITINNSSPTWDDLYYIIRKDDTTWKTSWWDEVDTDYAPSGSITTTSSKATIYFWVKAQDSCKEGDHWCYSTEHSGTYYLINTVTVDIPEYETKYNVVYDANGGVGAPASQQKSSLSDLTLSSVQPTYTLSINYFNGESTSEPSNETTANRTFNYWDAYHTCNNTNSITFTGDGTTTTYPTTTAGFNPMALSIVEVVRNGFRRVPPNSYSLVNNHIVFNTAPLSGSTYTVTYRITASYSDLDSDSPYYSGGLYKHNQNVWMVANWGNATFTPINMPAEYYIVTFNYNGGVGSPSTKTVARANLGYSTSAGSSTVAYQPGVQGTTTTNLNLYPVYGNATLYYNQLPKPTREGFSFEGWYLDSQLTNKITEDIIVTQNITVYAKWIALPINQFTPDGDWSSIGPYVWRMGEDHQWHKIAHIMQMDNNNHWVDISGS